MVNHGRSLAFASMAALTLLVGTVGAPVAARGGSATAETGLLASLDSHTSVTRNPTTDRVGYLGGTAARPVASAAGLGHPTTARAASRSFLSRYGALFGIPDAARSLRVSHTQHVAGRTFVRYQQTYRGLPVVAGELIVQVSRRNDVISVTGEASPDVSLSTKADISAARARALAISATAVQEKVKASTLRAGQPFLSVYDPRLTGDPRAIPAARLVWRVDVTSSHAPIREFVAIDAHSGVLAAAFNQIAYVDPPATATQRVCDLNSTSPSGVESSSADLLQCDPGDATQVSNPGSSVNPDIKGAFDGAEATFDFYANHFGRNSLNDAGLTLVSTARFCPLPSDPNYQCPNYPNAFWNGVQMYYGTGYSSADDVVGHELTHGVTEFSSHLLYWFQSGAINESMSDIFGEYIDLQDGIGDDSAGVRWELAEDIPIGAIRNMKTPGAFGQPDRMTSASWHSGFGDNGGVHYDSGVGNKAAYLLADGDTFNGQTIAALGIDKAAAIFYRVNTALLTSGADYAALADALHQACNDLVGTHPNNYNGAPSASGVISSGDCTQVDKTITATEMRLSPPTEAIKHAKWCSTGTPTTTPFDDAINATATGWTTNSSAVQIVDNYATSAPYSLALFDQANPTVKDKWARTKRITLPASGPIYLGFRHYVNTYSPYDGGRVEYTTNATGASGWTAVPAAKWTFNGPSTTLQSGNGNPLQGSKAFSGFSNGWAFSKADLTSLHGKKIFLRFRYGNSTHASFLDGWFVDDVRVYKCVTDTTNPVVGKPKLDLALGTLGSDALPALVKVSFTAKDASGIFSTNLRRKVGAGDSIPVDLPSIAATSVTTKLPVSASLQTFQAGARDGADRVASASTTAHILATQDDDGAVVYTGAWSSAAGSFYGGTVENASAAGRKAALTVANATDLAVVSTKGPDRGKADIYVDGTKKATVDLYGATLKTRQVVYSIGFTSAGSHTIEVRVLGTKNASSSATRVDVDAFLAITN